MTPLVSVIVPAYNYARYLPEALESVRQQTVANWECVIVDDASTDDTAAVARHWTESDSRFRLIRQDANKGVSAARNRGIAESGGEMLQFLDADDLLLPEKIARHARFLDEHRETGVVYSEGGFFHNTPSRLTPSLHGTLSRSIMARVNGDAWEKLQHYNIMPTPCALVRRDAAARAGGFAEASAGGEDWDFWLRCAAAGVRFDFCGDDAPLVAIRAHERSASRDNLRMLHGLVAAAKSWPGAALPLIYEVALGVDAVLRGERRAGSGRIAAAAARASEPLTAKRWRAYALAARVLPKRAFLRVVAWPLPEWPLELHRRLRRRT